LQRIFDGHVKSLKILKEFIPEASLRPDPDGGQGFIVLEA